MCSHILDVATVPLTADQASEQVMVESPEDDHALNGERNPNPQLAVDLLHSFRGTDRVDILNSFRVASTSVMEQAAGCAWVPIFVFSFLIWALMLCIRSLCSST